MKIWLDDERAAPPGWIHVKNVVEAISLLQTEQVEEISLDNDLGHQMKEGREVARYIEEAAIRGIMPRIKIHVHTANPVARQYMLAAIRNAEKAWG
jgi:hypothetical protein